jgi:hypothetical protein
MLQATPRPCSAMSRKSRARSLGLQRDLIVCRAETALGLVEHDNENSNLLEIIHIIRVERFCARQAVQLNVGLDRGF